MNYQGIEDEFLPADPKPSLQQYDNYQLYDVICTDILTETFKNNVVVDLKIKKKKAFLAVQAYSIIPIKTDFIQIAKLYK